MTGNVSFNMLNKVIVQTFTTISEVWSKFVFLSTLWWKWYHIQSYPGWSIRQVVTGSISFQVSKPKYSLSYYQQSQKSGVSLSFLALCVENDTILTLITMRYFPTDLPCECWSSTQSRSYRWQIHNLFLCLVCLV